MPGPEVGLFGKLPARGDFVRRRLDEEFIEAWDAWLQRVIAASREALGSRWLECFLSAPVWRFVVPAGMYSKAGWVGLMLPSVDRVGRYFPLTLAAPLAEDGIDVPATLAKAQPWLDQLEALALEALAPELDFEAFDRRLAELAPPAGLAVPAVLSDDTVPLGGAKVLYQVWPLRADDEAQGGLPGILQNAGARASAAMWLTRGGDTFGPHLVSSGGPIPGSQFCALLDAAWTEHSWMVAPSIAPAAVPPEAKTVTYCDPPTPGVDLIHGQGRGEEGTKGDAGPLTATPGSKPGSPWA